MLDEATRHGGCGVGAEGPGGVKVSDWEGHVGEVLDHHPFPDVFARGIEFLPVDGEGDCAGEAEAETGRCDDDVGVKGPAVIEGNRVRGHVGDGASDHIRLPRLQPHEEISVRAGAEALLPGVITRHPIRLHLRALR